MRQSGQMDPRRGGRPSQVRLRPPSDGRPVPKKVRPVAPSAARLARHRRIERRRGLPPGLNALLMVAILALGATIVWVGSGTVGPLVSGVVSGFGGFVTKISSSVGSQPPTAPPAISGAPAVLAPAEPYTNVERVDITVQVPSAVVGQSGYSVRLWDTVGDTPATIIQVAAVGPTAALLFPGVTLVSGRNDIQASIVGPSGESERSAVATWVLDQVAPKISISTPKDGSAVSAATVTIKGKTQATSAVVLRNDANGATASTAADQDGLFQLVVAVAAGVNAMSITATDPAGNATTITLTVRKGSGTLVVSLTGSVYRFSAAKLPRDATFTVVVTGPDGKPMAGATALFTVTVPGLQAIVSAEILTDDNGAATFSTQIPMGAMPGSGLASVLVTTPTAGSGTDRKVLTTVN
jgi:hypothetical protein